MSVVLETSLGDIVIDLHKQANIAAKNFIKLCKAKFYNGALFFNVQKDYLAAIKTQASPKTIYNTEYFEDQINPLLRHNKYGCVATSNSKPHANNSDFYILLTSSAPQLDSKHTIFGQVQEGLDVLEKLNQTHIDDDGRPLLNIRIKHTYILDDPYSDDENINYPSHSPSPHYKAEGRVEFDEKLNFDDDEEILIKKAQHHQSKKRAVTLEMLGDIPDADMKPPENVLYVCKLNPITQEKDLEVIFSKYGGIKNCEVVRDWKTGSSLQYAFIEFDTVASCEEAYVKMENALIDERRIHVDFCQSAHQQWSLLRKAQRKKKELNLQRELSQKNKKKDQSQIEQLELKKDYFYTATNNQFVIDQQDLQKLQDEQFQQLLQQQKEEKLKKQEQKKQEKVNQFLKKQHQRSNSNSNNEQQKHKKKNKKRSRSRSNSIKKNKQDKKLSSKINQIEKLQQKIKQDDILLQKEQIVQDNQNDQEKQIEKDKELELEKEREKKKEREREREREKEKEKEKERQKEREKKQKEKEKREKEQKEREKQRAKEKERQREKERKERKQRKEKEREKQKQKEREKQKEIEKQQQKLKQKQNEQDKQNLEKKNQQQENQKTTKQKSNSSSSTSSSSSSSSSSDSDSSSESSSSEN